MSEVKGSGIHATQKVTAWVENEVKHAIRSYFAPVRAVAKDIKKSTDKSLGEKPGTEKIKVHGDKPCGAV